MHVRYLRMAVHFLTFLALLVCPILLTLHWTGSPTSFDTDDLASEFTSLAKNESNEIHATSVSLPSFYGGLQQQAPTNETLDHFRSNSTLYYLSIANISNRNPILWVHVVFVYIVSLLWMWLLFVNHIHHLDLLQQQQQQQQEEDAVQLHERSVLVTHVPHHLRNQLVLQQYMERAQVGQVERVTLVSSAAIRALEVILKKRAKEVNRLETGLIAMARKAQNMHEKEPLSWYEWLSYSKDRQIEMGLQDQIVMIKRVLEEMQEMDNEINRLRDANRAPEYYMPTGAAFVTFKYCTIYIIEMYTNLLTQTHHVN
jgi:hypothetical protein